MVNDDKNPVASTISTQPRTPLYCSLALVVFLWTLLGSSVANAADPIVGNWQFYNKTTRHFREDGTSNSGKGPVDAAWKFAGMAGPFRKYVVVYGGKVADTLLLKEGDNLLEGAKGFRTATRIQSAKPAAAPKTPATPASAPAITQDKEMALANDWMPRRIMTGQEMLRSLAFFSLAAINGAEKGHEQVPSEILGGITWLMPLDVAEKKLTGAQYKLRDYRLQNPCFPQNSIFVKSFAGSFTDPNSREFFKEARLICDAKMRVISVELTCNHPKAGAWLWEEPQRPWWTSEPWMKLPQDVDQKDLPALTGASQRKSYGADGRREPYYDFVELKNNATTQYQVWYQVHRVPSGTTCIHTMLVEPIVPFYLAKVIENVRWYVPAPFARKLLDIALANKPASAPVR